MVIDEHEFNDTYDKQVVPLDPGQKIDNVTQAYPFFPAISEQLE